MTLIQRPHLKTRKLIVGAENDSRKEPGGQVAFLPSFASHVRAHGCLELSALNPRRSQVVRCFLAVGLVLTVYRDPGVPGGRFCDRPVLWARRLGLTVSFTCQTCAAVAGGALDGCASHFFAVTLFLGL